MSETGIEVLEDCTGPDTIIRPTYHANKEISFLWTPGEKLAELVYIPRLGLRFALKDRAGSQGLVEEVDGFRPLQWIGEYARIGGIKLPSRPKEYRSLDSLAASIRTFIHSYFDCDEAFESAATLYVLHSWLYERFHAVPYLRFLGISGSGKSRATETIGSLCYRPLVIAGSATPAPMYRMIEAVGGTMLIDEADFADSQIGTDIAKILNCGYTKGMPVTRLDSTDNGYVPRPHQVFGPKIINGRRPFQDDATESRCLTHTPVLTERMDIPTQLPPGFQDEALHIRNMALTWRFDRLDAFQVKNVVLPEIRRRTNQILSPLVLIAEQMEPPSAERYRRDLMRYAVAMEGEALEERRDTAEGRVLRAFIDLKSTGADPTCKEIADKVIKDHGHDDPKLLSWLNPKTVSKILKNMGFEITHTNKGSVVRIDPKRLAALTIRYGIVTHLSREVEESDGYVTMAQNIVTASTSIN